MEGRSRICSRLGKLFYSAISSVMLSMLSSYWQWLLSLRRKVTGWNQRHCLLPVVILDSTWYHAAVVVGCVLKSLHLWHMWICFFYLLYVDDLVRQGICFVCVVHVCARCLDTWWSAIALLFAGAFERPSFGNGEVPLWSVAVCVSGRFNNSCHRINFHSGENRDCSWLCASFASEFGLSRLAWDGACRKASLYTTKFGVCFSECCLLFLFPSVVP